MNLSCKQYYTIENEFKHIYERLLKSIILNKPYLCLPTSYFKNRIKQMYDTGQIQLDTVDDLENVLNVLNTWKMEDYKKIKKRNTRAINNFGVMQKPTLSSLYKSLKIQTKIYKLLEEIFNKRYQRILDDARAYKPYLCNAAECYFDEIKEKFIEEGAIFEDYEDVERILNELKVWKYPEYNAERNEFIKQYPQEKVLRFNKEI